MTDQKGSIYCKEMPADWDPYRQPDLALRILTIKAHDSQLRSLKVNPADAVGTCRKLMQLDDDIMCIHLCPLREDGLSGDAIWGIYPDKIRRFHPKTDIRIFVGAGNWE